MMLKSINPATEEIVGEVVNSREKEVKEVVAKARKAFQTWKNSPFEQREKIIFKMAEIIKKREKELSELITSEMGKPINQAIGEVDAKAKDPEIFIELVKNALKEEILDLGNPSIQNKVIFEPKGVVAGITPWNYPLSIPIAQIIQNLLIGNTIIIKPSEYTPLIAVEIEKIFKEAGAPDGVVNVLTGDKETGKFLVESDVDVITLTGSVGAGKYVAEKGGAKLKKVVLELGGCDPFIVCEDANLERAVNGATWGRFINCGQVCCSAKRIYVHEKLYDEFVKKFVEKVKTLKVGDPMDTKNNVGSLVSDIQLKRLEEQVKRAVDAGAKVLLGGKRLERKGYFFEPTILEISDNKNPAMQEEFFGPVAAIMKVKNWEQAVELANDNEYGLAGSVWSNDDKKAEKIAGMLECGTVWINAVICYRCQCPWGGTKNSGIGRVNSKFGILELINIKQIETTENKNEVTEDYWF